MNEEEKDPLQDGTEYEKAPEPLFSSSQETIEEPLLNNSQEIEPLEDSTEHEEASEPLEDSAEHKEETEPLFSSVSEPINESVLEDGPEYEEAPEPLFSSSNQSDSLKDSIEQEQIPESLFDIPQEIPDEQILAAEMPENIPEDESDIGTSEQRTGPTVTWTIPPGTKAASFFVRGKWSVAVTGFTSSNISVTNGTLEHFIWFANNRDFQFVLTPTPNSVGIITITIAAGSVTPYNTEQTETVQYSTPPTVTWTGVTGTKTEAFTVYGHWDQAVTGFDRTDVSFHSTETNISVNRGTITDFNLNANNRDFSFLLTPPSSGSGTITITIPAGQVSPYNRVESVIVNYDTGPAPTVTWTIADGIYRSAFTIHGQWSQAVSGFTSSDITVSSGTTSNFNLNANNRDFSVTVDPPSNSNGTVTITIPAGSGNINPSNTAAQEKTITYDTRPIVTWAGITGTKTGAFTISGRWNQTITGFTNSDVSVNSGVISNFNIESNNRSFSFTLAPPSGNTGNITLTIASGSVTPSNPEIIETITYDTRDKVNVTIATAIINTNNRSISWSLTLSHSGLTGFDLSDIINREPSTATVAITGSGTSRTLIFSGFDIGDTGTASFSIRAAAFTLSSLPSNYENNLQIESDSASYDFREIPNVTWTIPPGTLTASFFVRGRWSVPVTGFTSSDISITNGTLEHFIWFANNRDFQFVLTPPSNSNGTIRITIPANRVVPPNAELTRDITYDTTTPTGPTIEWNNPGTVTGTSFTARGRWSVAVTGFNIADINVDESNGIGKSNFILDSNNRDFSFVVTWPSPGRGLINITIPANRVTPANPEQRTSVYSVTGQSPISGPTPIPGTGVTAIWTAPRTALRSGCYISILWSQAINPDHFDFNENNNLIEVRNGSNSDDISGTTISEFTTTNNPRDFWFYFTPPSGGPGTIEFTIPANSNIGNDVAQVHSINFE